MNFNTPVTDLIKQRTSTRTYQKRVMDDEKRKVLTQFLRSLHVGPLGNSTRFELVAATPGDSKTLRGLGTYGFIKNPAGFIVGTTIDGGNSLEDFGFQMEAAILYATDLGLGTCWLGGTFTKSRFVKRISAGAGEILPAVTSVGYPAHEPRRLDGEIRQRAKSDRRLSWERLFFKTRLGEPISKGDAGEYAIPLEMVRLGPSASNRQPWRIVRDEEAWHFYLRRTRGYLDKRSARLLKLEDLQRVDIGIAMCHFELTAREIGLDGVWLVEKPDLPIEWELTEYTASWVPGDRF